MRATLPIRDVLSPEKCIAAYETTGLELVHGYWTKPGCACAASVVAIASGLVSREEIVEVSEDGGEVAVLLAHALKVDDGELRAFVVGFDGEHVDDSERGHESAHALGVQVAHEVESWIQEGRAAERPRARGGRA